MNWWRRRSLRIKVVGGTLAFLAIVSLATGLHDLRSERRDHLEQVRKLGFALSSSTAVFCVQPLLLEDYPVIEGYLTDLVDRNQDVAEVVVELDDGRWFLKAAGSDARSAHDNSDWFISDIRPMADDSRTLGRVRLRLSPTRFERLMAERIDRKVAQSAFTFFALALLLFFLLKRTVADPVRQLDGQAHGLGLGNLDTPIASRNADDELGRLAQTLDLMRRNLKTSYTTLKERNSELDSALQRAEIANRAKSEFLANMNHEVRTPLNGVLATAELLGRTPLSPEQNEYLGIVRQSASTLQELLNDVLFFTDGDGGSGLGMVDFDLRQLIEEVLQTHRDEARAKGLGFGWFIGADAPAMLRGDAARLRRIVVKLVANAVKFTESGSVLIRFDVESAPEGLLLRGSVEDTGPGVDDATRASLFEPFTLGDGSSTRRHGGAGLSLSICRRFARQMGGDVVHEPREPRGSRFLFTVKLFPSSAPAAKAPAKPVAKVLPRSTNAISGAVRVLLAEDNLVNQRLTTRLLQQRGFEVDVAANGVEAVHAAGRGGYQLVFMDCQMPEMDGYEATGEIRRIDANHGRQTPIIAVTANADRERCLSAGMDDFLAKPLNVAELDRVIERWLPVGKAS